jgi:hypothetical protein
MATKQNQTPNESKKRKQRDSVGISSDSDIDTSESNKQMGSFPHFFVIEPRDGLSFDKVSPFAIEKSLSCTVGTMKTVKKLQSGSLLVEVTTYAYALLVQKLEALAGIPVKVSEHRTLNSSRGVIRCRDLRDCDDAEVLAELKPCGVIAIKHIMSKRDGATQPTNTFVLTFNSATLPPFIKVGYLRVKVELFIPNPLRCFNCQKYGHGRFTCKRGEVCANCGQEGHNDQACPNESRCANCCGPHPAYSKQCTQWHTQAAITRLKVEKNISFRDAEDILKKQSGTVSLPQNGSYASKVTAKKSSCASVSCQTDLTWPLTSELPFTPSRPIQASSPVAHSSSQTPTTSASYPTPPDLSLTPTTVSPSPSTSLSASQAPTAKAPTSITISSQPSPTSTPTYKTINGRKVGPDGQLQKSAQAPSKPGNRFQTLQEVDMDIQEDLGTKAVRGPKSKMSDRPAKTATKI